jgi:glutamyl-Q tRNA(Asp) synthetase
MNRYCGRFAPTPSGPLHFGSMIAAIASYCDARANDGSWHVRIDDIDQPRVVAGAAGDILRTLTAFGLAWDREPVFQSRNSDSYHAAIHLLRSRAQVFACSCSRKDINEAVDMGTDSSLYPGTCRNGLPAGRRARSLRLHIDDDARAGFIDLLQGSVSQQLATEVGDFVIYRSGGIFSYHLACAVDDAYHGITHIVRGADLLDSTPRQIHLQVLLGLPTPAYLHLPVATNEQGQKMSKQAGATGVDHARAGEIIHSALMFLGQRPPSDLARAPPRTAIEWGVHNWRRENLPKARAIAAMPQDQQNQTII